LTKFYVDFVGEDGTEVPDVYWRRKAGNQPDIQKPVYGTMTQGNYGPMFKMEQRDGGSYQSPVHQGSDRIPAPGAAAAAQSAAAYDDRQRRIERQHSQEMALRLIDASGYLEDLDLTDKALVGTILNETVKPLTDWFAKDLEPRT
jgi:hypothetical protein